jgi:hypothetical protein
VNGIIGKKETAVPNVGRATSSTSYSQEHKYPEIRPIFITYYNICHMKLIGVGAL